MRKFIDHLNLISYGAPYFLEFINSPHVDVGPVLFLLRQEVSEVYDVEASLFYLVGEVLLLLRLDLLV